MTHGEKREFLEKTNACCPYNTHNGITVADVGEGFCVVEGELNDKAFNPWGMAHGGFVYSLCDVAAGVAVAYTGRHCVTLSGSMSYLRPSKGTKLRAEGRIIKDGKTIVVVEASVYDDGGTLTARGSFELFIVGSGNEE